jgi:hypothetical protein
MPFLENWLERWKQANLLHLKAQLVVLAIEKIDAR